VNPMRFRTMVHEISTFMG